MRKTAVKSKAAACSKCGKCRQVCPSFLEELSETMVARGRIHLAAQAEDGGLQATPNLKKAISTCMLCLRCSEHCPNRVEIENIIIPAREQFLDRKSPAFLESFIYKYVVSRRRPLIAAVKMMGLTNKLAGHAHMTGIYRSLLNRGFSLDEKRRLPSFNFKNLFDLFPPVISAPGNTRRVAYFPGCSAALSLLNVSGAIIRTLVRSGADVVLPRTGCCGIPAYTSGFYALAEKSARENVKILKASGADILITGCGSCGKMLRDTYKEMLGADSHNLKVMDISEYLMENKPAPGNQPIPLQVTYHDPCHLRRSMKVFEQPRVLLKSIPGVDFIEMTDADVCCGAGGSLSLKYYDLTRKVRKNKNNMFLRTHASVLATGCPACILHLEDGFAEQGIAGRVVHPIELLDQTYAKS